MAELKIIPQADAEAHVSDVLETVLWQSNVLAVSCTVIYIHVPDDSQKVIQSGAHREISGDTEVISKFKHVAEGKSFGYCRNRQNFGTVCFSGKAERIVEKEGLLSGWSEHARFNDRTHEPDVYLVFQIAFPNAAIYDRRHGHFI